MEGKIELKQVLEFELIQKVLDDFCKATELRSVIVDIDGKPVLLPQGGSQECSFCKVVKHSKEGYKKCCGTYMRAGREAAKLGEPYISRCHAGLIIWAVPLVIEEHHVGSIICGQVLMWEPEKFFWIEVSRMNKDLGKEVETLIEKGKELTIVSAEKVEAVANLLFIVANHLMKMFNKVLEQSKEMAMHKVMLGIEIKKRKMLEEVLQKVKQHPETGNKEQNIETELLNQIKIGDCTGAQKSLGDILTDVSARYGNTLPLFKARILELLGLLSRMAVEDGIDHDRVLAYNYGYTDEIGKCNSVEDVCFWARRVVDGFIKEIYRTQILKNKKVINHALNYILSNFDQSLSLEKIASRVFLSPYYLSHLFKKELGCTVMDCVTKARIEEAKRLLKHSSLSITEVAKKVGYKDIGHFSKVFKQKEGVSPSAIKNKLYKYKLFNK